MKDIKEIIKANFIELFTLFSNNVFVKIGILGKRCFAINRIKNVEIILKI